jgi:MOSC domain-containing protein YiiM
MTPPAVVAVSRDGEHRFSKTNADLITLLAGLGVEGDAHAGLTVQHLSRVKHDPSQPNLRQVHLIPAELHDELRTLGYDVAPGQLGENITTSGVDLRGLPRGTVLRLGADAAVRITGLRSPCRQINGLQEGLMAELIDTDELGNVIRKAGVMAVVLSGGLVRPGDKIAMTLPAPPHHALEPV